MVVSQALPSVTLASSLASVGFGGRTALLGKVSSGKAGERVQVLARPCGKLALSRVATVKTKAGGAYRVLVKPHRNTAYGVRWKQTSSAALQVPVRPLVRLRAAGGVYSLRVYAGLSFAGRRALLQRFDEAEDLEARRAGEARGRRLAVRGHDSLDRGREGDRLRQRPGDAPGLDLLRGLGQQHPPRLAPLRLREVRRRRRPS